MKYEYVLFIFSTVMVILNDVRAHGPPQTACTDLKAVPLKASKCACGHAPNMKSVDCEDLAAFDNKQWVISKTTKTVDSFPDNKNYCSAALFGPDCRGMFFATDVDVAHQSIISHEFAFNEKTKNYVHYTKEYHLKDFNYQIFQGEVIEMEYHDEEVTVTTKENPIPEIVAKSHNVMVAVIAADKNKNWFILQSCDKKRASVAFSFNLVLKDKERTFLETYKAEIESELEKHGIDKSTMIDVPIKQHYEFELETSRSREVSRSMEVSQSVEHKPK